MITTIELRHNNECKWAYVSDELNPQEIWNNIKQSIKQLKACNLLSFDNLYKRIVTFNKYYYAESDDGGTIFDQMYNCYLSYTDDHISFEVRIPDRFDYNDERPANMIPLRDLYIINPEYKGNCVDDFIARGVESRLALINTLVEEIKDRVIARISVFEYHQTDCYEKDFTAISLIKYNAQKLLDNCNKQLEQLSEKYTKN